MINGWLILDKPLGLGSTQGVSAVKRALREAGEPKHRVGHGGTLDPLATGVLPIAIGEATKLAGRMLDATKVYEFTITFGSQTDTLDLEGAVIAISDVRPTLTAIEAVLPRFTGPIEQVPPNYSALKVDGKRAYDMARAGEEFALKTRAVTVHLLQIRPDLARGELECVTLSATVSKGTYIRSLARDIAIALGTVGHVTMLRRTKAGPFDLSHAISLDKLTDLATARSLDGAVLPLSAGLDDIPALPVTPAEATLLRHGQKLTRTLATPGLHLATDAGRPVALVEAGTDGLTVVRGFNI
ncbi:tRNA pseudouridine(55) synthase TruB [Sphingomonas sp. RB1R13]|uniref:tRNA pseudouridine(55) synthase TruB n=1 Tax=Sphingomonas sp. RB1R13 TaxID=3096159 RepID=UPI002FCBD85C